MTKVVYVTGCFGFIGSYVTRACLEKGWYVRGIDKCTYASNEDLLFEFAEKYGDRFTFEREDINDIKFLYECDYVINTAAETHVGNSIASADEFVHSNIDGKPSNPYSATKAAADMLVLAWARTYNLPYVIVRPTNNYGIGQYVEKLIPKACKFLHLGKKVPLHNNGTPIRNWLHAKDTASAVVTIIESGVENEIYNIAGGFEQSNYETVKKLIKVYNGSDNVEDYLDLSYYRKGQDVRYALDDSKLRSLGWKPKAIFDQEIEGIVDYYRHKFIW